MIPILKERFHESVDRARNLVALYEQITGLSKGRPSVREADLLRAAVVFLHAAIEDLPREIAIWRLPAADPEVLSDIPFGDQDRSAALTLTKLARCYRGQSVDDVISQSVVTYLNRTSYNNTKDIAKLLIQLGCGEAKGRLLKEFGPMLQTVMSRRHQIAHRLDRNEDSGSGQHGARSISKRTVQIWIDHIVRFSNDLFEEVGKIAVSPEAES